MGLRDVSAALRDRVGALHFGKPTTHVYNPLDYAWDIHARYLDRYGGHRPKAVLLGMNPGPFGMAQTGVPFGEVAIVRDWLGLAGPVHKPQHEHPARPVTGFDCKRSEVSGARLWGWAREYFGTPEKFFASFFVINYCPLVFMEESGKNRTPDKLPAKEQAPLFAACDDALRAAVELLGAKMVIGVGAFAEDQAASAFADNSTIKIGRILHPSPASPLANKGWAELAMKDLRALGAI